MKQLILLPPKKRHVLGMHEPHERRHDGDAAAMREETTKTGAVVRPHVPHSTREAVLASIDGKPFWPYGFPYEDDTVDQ